MAVRPPRALEVPPLPSACRRLRHTNHAQPMATSSLTSVLISTMCGSWIRSPCVEWNKKGRSSLFSIASFGLWPSACAQGMFEMSSNGRLGCKVSASVGLAFSRTFPNRVFFRFILRSIHHRHPRSGRSIGQPLSRLRDTSLPFTMRHKLPNSLIVMDYGVCCLGSVVERDQNMAFLCVCAPRREKLSLTPRRTDAEF